jgi:hypothetical protein
MVAIAALVNARCSARAGISLLMLIVVPSHIGLRLDRASGLPPLGSVSGAITLTLFVIPLSLVPVNDFSYGQFKPLWGNHADACTLSRRARSYRPFTS